MSHETATQQGSGFSCQVAVPVPLPTTFTYRVPEALQKFISVGARVRVPFRQRQLVGVVTALDAETQIEHAPADGLRDVIEVIDREPLLTPALLKLAQWITDYYFAPPGE
ncbi:MAG: hypothetical protein HY653_00360, partial [Acidobacteria bacterium]|nr:hypothetical protein [Acidobacteriota bacterium]